MKKAHYVRCALRALPAGKRGLQEERYQNLMIDNAIDRLIDHIVKAFRTMIERRNRPA